MKRELFIATMGAGNVGKIALSGYLSAWKDSGNVFTSQLDQLINDGATKIELSLNNCYGGSVFEGAVISAAIRNCLVDVVGKVAGACASMGTIIFASCDERLMDMLGLCITHRASTESSGCWETLQEDSGNLKKLNDQMAQVYAEVTGMSIEDVNANLMPKGKDIYLTAKDCLKNKLATGVWNSGIKAAMPLAVAAQSNLKAVAAYYDKQLEIEPGDTSENNPTNMDIKLVAAAIGMAGEGDEAKIAAALAKLKQDKDAAEARVAELEATAKTNAEQAAVTMVKDAVAAGKITAAEEESYTTLAKSNMASVKAILDQKKPYKPAHMRVTGEAGEGDTNPYGRKAGETDAEMFARLQKTNSKLLTKMQADNKELFAQLKDAYLAQRNS